MCVRRRAVPSLCCLATSLDVLIEGVSEGTLSCALHHNEEKQARFYACCLYSSALVPAAWHTRQVTTPYQEPRPTKSKHFIGSSRVSFITASVHELSTRFWRL
ncbi:hypothetical protein E2C01_081392 [Portunus trituberculatus]|uniref:Uncharacterized protein n=1 Tax=Portunus trituberculatus TaxID=210409 RepID=A0A5B7IPN1_PORTR|nr:hypothetical protein [Portunus trituberculatus]